MIVRSSQLPTAAVLADDQRAPSVVTCPMCHTPASLAQSAIDAGWRCVTCGQHWDAERLRVVAAYAAWVVERAAGEGATLSHNAPIERRDGI